MVLLDRTLHNVHYLWRGDVRPQQQLLLVYAFGGREVRHVAGILAIFWDTRHHATCALGFTVNGRPWLQSCEDLRSSVFVCCGIRVGVGEEEGRFRRVR